MSAVRSTPRPAGPSGSAPGRRGNRPANASQPEPAVLALPIDELHGITPTMVRTLRAAGCPTIGSLLRARRAALLELRSFGPVRVKRVLDAARRMVADAEGLPSVGATPAAVEEALARRQPFVATVASEFNALEARVRMVLDRTHFAAGGGEGLRTLAGELGVSRERVRQLALVGIRDMPHSRRAAKVADAHIGARRIGRSAPLTVAELERDDLWLAGCATDVRFLRGMLDATDATHRVAQYDPGLDIVVTRAFPPPAQWPRWWVSRSGTSARQTPDPARVRAVVAAVGAAELADHVLEVLTRELGRTTVQDRVRAAVLRVAGPQSVQDVQARLAAEGTQMSVRAITAVLHNLGAILIDRSTYTLREQFSAWEWLRKPAQDAVERILRTSKRIQWNCNDLLAELRRTEPRWPGLASSQVLDCLLRDSPRLARHRRGGYQLRGRRGPSAEVVSVARDVMRAAGRPISSSELHRRVSEVRSVAGVVASKWPIVWLGRDLWGLADRDLGLATDRIGAMDQRVRARLDASGRVRAQELTDLVAAVWPEAKPIEPGVVARWMRPRVRAYFDEDGTGLSRERVRTTPLDDAAAGG